MAQESWKKETDETEVRTPDAPILCANNCGFFGSAVTNNLCSKCYRDFIMKQQQQLITTPATARTAELILKPAPLPPSSNLAAHPVAGEVKNDVREDSKGKKPANRCFLCKKRVGLTCFQCRCGGTFCSIHRYSETHECTFDYKASGREAIAKENPVIKADKIEKI